MKQFVKRVFERMLRWEIIVFSFTIALVTLTVYERTQDATLTLIVGCCTLVSNMVGWFEGAKDGRDFLKIMKS